jgi:hypothetical protein
MGAGISPAPLVMGEIIMGTTPLLGDTVRTNDGRTGVVADKSLGEALIRLFAGSELDITHGSWLPFFELEITGHDPDAMVWRGSRMELAM